ncbi:hypothetical protein CMEL01_14594 [Colletotrichum melonis]|uniref:Mg2+ transporter n=1 Tax=Colletotrichum melonis TaxID=1209925 RepID=A0AAI9XW12_9PEZI|nr:hypothetical protein CMEL01_14594 [Colletotrichum melonis]
MAQFIPLCSSPSPAKLTGLAIPTEANMEARQRETYASFGHEGITATANAYGNLMQITRYIGESSHNPSGFIRAELTHYDPDGYRGRVTQHANGLASVSARPNDGVHLRLQDREILGNNLPEISFIQNRWPRFQSSTGHDVQYFISKETVFQVYTLEVDKQNGMNQPLDVEIPVKIRLLNLSNGIVDADASKTKSAGHHSPQTPPRPEESFEPYPGEISSDDDLEDGIDFHDPSFENWCDACEGNGKVEFHPKDSHHDIEQGIGLSITVFVGNCLLPRLPRRNGGKIIIKVDHTFLKKSFNKGKVEITLAYTLKRLSPSLTLPISPADLRAKDDILGQQFETLQLKKDRHLNFVLLRNVEHVLSVCSVPVYCEYGCSNEDPPIAITCGDIAGHRIVTEASFHAFRFLLLALREVKQILKNRTQQNYGCDRSSLILNNAHACNENLCEYYRRILRVCRGHAKWVTETLALNHCQENDTDGRCRHNPKVKGKSVAYDYDKHRRFWASGKSTIETRSVAVSPLAPQMEVVFHILKFEAFSEFCVEFGAEAYALEPTHAFKVMVESWLENLHRKKHNGLHSFPREEEKQNSLKTFYLADHAMIWWAVRSAEKLKLGSQLRFDYREKLKKTQTLPLFGSDRLQRIFLKRFTAENPISRRMMFARSRSALKVGFIFEVEDTKVFHAAKQNLFAHNGFKTSSIWENTMDCQRYSSENEVYEWEHPLQFALAMMLSSQGKRVNSIDPSKMYEIAKAVLLKTSSPNGLMAGKLDSRQEPTTFCEGEAQDLYWSTLFEVPYILWTYPCPEFEQADSQPRASAVTDQLPMLEEAKLIGLIEQLTRRLRSQEAEGAEPFIMERNLPFGSHIGQKRITDFTDEWLYDEPKSVNFSPKLSCEQLAEFANKHGADERGGKSLTADKASADVRHQAIRHLSATESDNSLDERMQTELHTELRLPITRETVQNVLKSTPMLGLVVDAQDKRAPNTVLAASITTTDTKEILTPIQSLEDLRAYLQAPRTRENSKKRLVQSFQSISTTALICDLALPKGGGMTPFFERHARYQIYQYDNAEKIFNFWATELHLSFWTLHKGPKEKISRQKAHCLPLEDAIPFPIFGYADNKITKRSGKTSKLWVQRAITSFRFEGDFLDRYWTCYFFEHDPSRPTPLGSIENNEMTPNAFSGTATTRKSKLEALSSREKSGRIPEPLFTLRDFDVRHKLKDICKHDAWRQRRVLELILFHRSLEQMIKGSNSVLEQVKEEVNKAFRPGKTGKETALGHNIPTLEESITLLQASHNDNYFDANKLCRKLGYLLEAICLNLDENMATIQDWLEREKRLERPRWTEKDERKFSKPVSMWNDLNDDKLLELKRCRDEIASYNSSLSKKLEDMRTELEFRGDNGIRLFTYVTAIFLPLGFATSIFSMSEAPSAATLDSMIKTGLIALAGTLIVLVNADVLERVVWPFVIMIRCLGYPLAVLFSWWYDMKDKMGERRKKTNEGFPDIQSLGNRRTTVENTSPV